MRAPSTRAHGQGHGLQPEPGRSGARIRTRKASIPSMSWTLTARSKAARLTRRRFRPFLPPCKFPFSSAAASAPSISISLWIKRGVARVILGTAAVRDPALVRQACARFPGKIAVGIDAKDGKVAVQGWAERPSFRRPSLRAASRIPASQPSFTPTSAATACSRPQPRRHRRDRARR